MHLFPFIQFLLLIEVSHWKVALIFSSFVKLLFFSPTTQHSDAITSTVHVSTGRHKLPGTVSFTEM